MASFQENWQTVGDSIIERGIFMFNNDLLSDVSLVVRSSSDEGESKKSKMAIPAHKFVLSICSPVFFAMFCGEMAERSDSVDLPDCEYEGVLEMLRYMYSGEPKLDESNVMQVLYVATKYMVNSLAGDCVRFLLENLDPANVFCVLSHAQQYDEEILVDQCWELIDRETEEAVKSEEFPTIERSLLEEIVKRDSLTIREIELFKAVDVWATKECERQGLSADGNVKREILGEKIVKEIRFPVMEEKEFASAVLDSEILTPQEHVKMMKHFNSLLTSPLDFHGDKRLGAYQSCFRFTYVGSLALSDTLKLGDKHCIHLHVDKDIMLHGICLFGSENNDYDVTLTVRKVIGQRGVMVVNKSGKFPSFAVQRKLLEYDGFDVMFDQPLKLSKDVRYAIKAKINGPRSCSGSFGRHQVVSHGVTFFFRECKNSIGTVDCGQFAEFLFKLP